MSDEHTTPACPAGLGGLEHVHKTGLGRTCVWAPLLVDRDADNSQPSTTVVHRLRLGQDVRWVLTIRRRVRRIASCTHNSFTSMASRVDLDVDGPSSARPTQPSNPRPRQLIVRVRCTRSRRSKSPRLHVHPSHNHHFRAGGLAGRLASKSDMSDQHQRHRYTETERNRKKQKETERNRTPPPTHTTIHNNNNNNSNSNRATETHNTQQQQQEPVDCQCYLQKPRATIPLLLERVFLATVVAKSDSQRLQG